MLGAWVHIEPERGDFLTFMRPTADDSVTFVSMACCHQLHPADIREVQTVKHFSSCSAPLPRWGILTTSRDNQTHDSESPAFILM